MLPSQSNSNYFALVFSGVKFLATSQVAAVRLDEKLPPSHSLGDLLFDLGCFFFLNVLGSNFSFDTNLVNVELMEIDQQRE